MEVCHSFISQVQSITNANTADMTTTKLRITAAKRDMTINFLAVWAFRNCHHPGNTEGDLQGMIWAIETKPNTTSNTNI